MAKDQSQRRILAVDQLLVLVISKVLERSNVRQTCDNGFELLVSSFITPASKPVPAAASHRLFDGDPDARPIQYQHLDHHDDLGNGTPSISPQSSSRSQAANHHESSTP